MPMILDELRGILMAPPVSEIKLARLNTLRDKGRTSSCRLDVGVVGSETPRRARREQPTAETRREHEARSLTPARETFGIADDQHRRTAIQTQDCRSANTAALTVKVATAAVGIIPFSQM